MKRIDFKVSSKEREFITLFAKYSVYTDIPYGALIWARCPNILSSRSPPAFLSSAFESFSRSGLSPVSFARVLLRMVNADGRRRAAAIHYPPNFYFRFYFLRLKNISRAIKRSGYSAHKGAGSFRSVCSGSARKRPQRELYTYLSRTFSYIRIYIFFFLFYPRLSSSHCYPHSRQIGPDQCSLCQPIIGNPTFNERTSKAFFSCAPSVRAMILVTLFNTSSRATRFPTPLSPPHPLVIESIKIIEREERKKG